MYALIPDGYTLKKVTKAQNDAVKDLKKHDDLIAILNNPQIISIVAGVATGAFLAKAITEIELPEVPNWEDIKPKVIEKSKQVSLLTNPFGIAYLGAKKGAELGGTSEEFDKAVKILKDLLPF